MEHFVTKEQVKHILEHHGHHVVMDSAFVTGAPMTEIEAIVDVCDVVAQAAYDQGTKDATERHIDLQNQMADRVAELTEFNQQLRAENKDFSARLEQLRLSNNREYLRGMADGQSQEKRSQYEQEKKFYQDGRQDAIKDYGTDWYVGRCAELEKQVEDLRQANKDLASAALSPNINEAEELEKAIETIQAALSGSFRDNLKIEVTEHHAWLTYGDLKFLVEPMEAWQAVQSCVYLSGLEVDNE